MIVFLQWSFWPVVAEASTIQKYNKKDTSVKEEEMFLDYIEKNYERESKNKKSIIDTELYDAYLKSEDDELYREIKNLKELNSDEIREMVCYLEVKMQPNGQEVYNIYNEEEFKDYIDENDIELDESYLEDCSWAEGNAYDKESSDGYMKFVFTSAKNNSGSNKYTMTLYFEWLKQPKNCEFDNYLCFGHDSNITVDNDSIRFYFYHYKKVKLL